MDLDSLENEDDKEEQEDEWRDRITKHLPSHVAPDDWIVNAFELGTVIAVAVVPAADEEDTDEPILLAVLAKIEAGTVEVEEPEAAEVVWFFPGCREWTVENAEDSGEEAARYLAGEITKAVK